MNLNYGAPKQPPLNPESQRVEKEFLQLKKDISALKTNVKLLRDKANMALDTLSAMNTIADTYRNEIEKAYETGKVEWAQTLEARMKSQTKYKESIIGVQSWSQGFENITPKENL